MATMYAALYLGQSRDLAGEGLTVVVRAQVQHEIDEDLDQLADRDDRDPGEGAGSR